jgi:hypothetical protein
MRLAVVTRDPFNVGSERTCHNEVKSKTVIIRMWNVWSILIFLFLCKCNKNNWWLYFIDSIFVSYD